MRRTAAFVARLPDFLLGFIAPDGWTAEDMRLAAYRAAGTPPIVESFDGYMPTAGAVILCNHDGPVESALAWFRRMDPNRRVAAIVGNDLDDMADAVRHAGRYDLEPLSASDPLTLARTVKILRAGGFVAVMEDVQRDLDPFIAVADIADVPVVRLNVGLSHRRAKVRSTLISDMREEVPSA